MRQAWMTGMGGGAAMTAVLVMLLGVVTSVARAGEDAAIDFNRDIRPILGDKCFSCHGPDENKRARNLRLDSFEGATAALKSGGHAIVPGEPDASEVMARVTAADPDERMPPAETNKTVSAEEVEVLRRWIAAGATYADHWAFLPPQRPELPSVRQGDWPRNGIDHFVLAKLEGSGLTPSPEASREALIRRVTLDLTGLPPTPEEVDAFLADDSPGAYERVVDRLLASPHYGEQMARSWLDLARYADTHGYQYDQERTMWPWRDWVIRAYNDNMPFDRFTVEQLAGDLLPNATTSQRLATGFNRNHGITVEGGIIDAEYRTEYVIDRITTMSTVWLGLTMNCARCHDHKFDPISMREFYQLFDFFNQVPERGNGGQNQFAPTMKAPTPAQQRALAELDEALVAAKAERDELMRAYASERKAWEVSLTERQGAHWETLKPIDAIAGEGTTLKVLEDDSILAGGDAAKETYQITLRTGGTGLTAIRLEALTHDSLPHRGPGRADNANFVLTEIRAKAVSLADPSREEPIRLVAAVADHSQSGYDITRAIDGNLSDQNGWAVDGPTRREDRTAVFLADNPFGFEGGTELRVELVFAARWANHAIGRARLSVTRDGVPALPLDVDRILALSDNERTDAHRARLDAFYLATAAPADLKSARDAIEALEKERQDVLVSIPSVMVMQDMPEKRKTHVLDRGQYDQPREMVSAGVPAALGALPEDAPNNRLGLAKWIVSPDNPLTARVTVNRYWHRYFGTGIVKTMEDFGSQAAWPSHPALLDYLAVEFIQSGWNIKHMQKLIVTSAAYRQTAQVTPQLLEADPENRLISRGPRQRMSAEMVRDTMLAASGLLTRTIGGPSVYPYQPPGLWMELNNRPGFSRAYQEDTGDKLYRRSLYTFWKRTVPPPSMQAFDAPEREFCTVRRSTTNTPLQALVLLHDPQFVEAARHLAERMIHDGGDNPAARVARGFKLVISRQPTEEETAILVRAYERALEKYRRDREAAERLLTVGRSPRDSSIDLSEHAAWTAVARIIMNTDQAITR